VLKVCYTGIIGNLILFPAVKESSLESIAKSVGRPVCLGQSLYCRPNEQTNGPRTKSYHSRSNEIISLETEI